MKTGKCELKFGLKIIQMDYSWRYPSMINYKLEYIKQAVDRKHSASVALTFLIGGKE